MVLSPAVAYHNLFSQKPNHHSWQRRGNSSVLAHATVLHPRPNRPQRIHVGHQDSLSLSRPIVGGMVLERQIDGVEDWNDWVSRQGIVVEESLRLGCSGVEREEQY